VQSIIKKYYMKKIIVFAILVSLAPHLKSQEDNTPAAQVAHHIANKMADTLELTNQQRAKIFVINMDLHKQKTTARGRSQDRNEVGRDLQKIEGSRDSMYKAVLTEAQYLLYIQKKRNLVTAQ
jgi:hypothetical protein